MNVSRLSSLIMIVWSIIAVAPCDAADWHQWRGPERSGQLPVNSLPEGFSEQLRKEWSIRLQPSYSTPLVVGDRVFVTETRDKKFEVVTAFDRVSGEKQWATQWTGAMSVPFFAAANGSWIRATPAADQTRLYVAGMRDVLVCLEQATGEIVWTVDFVETFKTPLPSFGFVSSPLLDDEHVYVQAGAAFCKLRKSDGSVVWRTLQDGGGMSGSAFSSPVFATLHQVPQILVQTRTHLAGVDPVDGTVLWKQEVEAFRGMNIVTPVAYGDTVFTSSYGGGSFLIDVSKQGDSWSSAIRWRNKLQGYMSTPVLVDGMIYLHLRNGRFASIDLETGQDNWISKPFGKYVSLLTDGGVIAALDERGDLLLIDIDPATFRIRDQLHLTDSPCWAHLVVTSPQLYVRSLDELLVYTFGEKMSQ